MTDATTCRSCGAEALEPFLSLGQMPLVDALRGPEELGQDEARYPLDVALCTSCGLAQLLYVPPPEVLFCRSYPYYSSFSPALVAHAKANVEARIAERGLNADSLVIELASNDGYLLQHYAQAGIPVLGIDPAQGPAKAAEQRGVPTLNTFFGLELAQQLAAEGRRADVIHGNNVLAHVPDLTGFVQGIATLLKPDGVAVIEAPYLKELVDHGEFDTIYHEHHCYLSVTAVDRLATRQGLRLVRVQPLSIHGGSLRYFFQPTGEPEASVVDHLAMEKELGLDTIAYYRDFGRRVESIKQELVELLDGLKAEGKRIAGYAAAAKGAVMLNYTGVGTQYLDYIVDRNTHKQGQYMPGIDLEVRDPAVLLDDQPDYLLLLAWNFKDEIMQQQAEYAKRGGRFIVPVPKPMILEAGGAS